MRLGNVGKAPLHLLSFPSQFILLPIPTPSCGVPLVAFAALLQLPSKPVQLRNPAGAISLFTMLVFLCLN